MQIDSNILGGKWIIVLYLVFMHKARSIVGGDLFELKRGYVVGDA